MNRRERLRQTPIAWRDQQLLALQAASGEFASSKGTLMEFETT